MASACPICAASPKTIIELKGGFTAERCTVCDAVFANPMPSEGDLAEYYSSWLFNLPAAEQLDEWRLHTADGIKRLLADPAVPTPVGRALDFGGGLGFFARALSDHADNVHLFDMSDASRNYARQAFGDVVTVHDRAEEALASGPFDLILLNQVIEHVPDPVSFLRPLFEALAPGGVLVVSTPNNAMADAAFRVDLARWYSGNAVGNRLGNLAKLFGDSWLCLDPPRHIYAFNRSSLVEAATRAGGKVRHVTSAGWNDDPLGYPMYKEGGSLLRWALGQIRKIGSTIAEAMDSDRERRNTLIGYFERA